MKSYKYLAYCTPKERLRLAVLRANILTARQECERIMDRANQLRQRQRRKKK